MRKKSQKYLPIVLLFVYLLFNTAQAFAASQSSIFGEVEAGSVGNEVRIRIDNNSKKAVTGVTATPSDVPGIVLNLEIEPKQIDTIAPVESAEFTVQFDISKDASTEEKYTVKFQLSTELGELEETKPEMTLTVEKVEEDKSGETPHPFGVPILKLVKISGPEPSERMKRVENEMGFTWTSHNGYGDTKTVSFSMKAPKTISPDKSFSVSAEVFGRNTYSKGRCLNYDRGYSPTPMTLSLKARGRGGNRSGLNDDRLLEAKGKDLQYYCLGIGLSESQKMPAKTIIGNMAMSFSFKPTREEVVNGTRKYYYNTSKMFSGVTKITKEAGLDEESVFYAFGEQTDGLGNLVPGKNVTDSTGFYNSIDITAITTTATIHLRYEPVFSGESGVTPIPHQHPPDLTIPIPDDNQDTQIAEDEDTGITKGSGTEEGVEDGETGVGPGEDGKTDGTIVTGPGGPDSKGPVDPNKLDPGKPEVASIIKKWISVAKPPTNVAEGVNLHYSNRGREVGMVKGGFIKSPHETGVFDAVFLWQNMRNLDSVDHCTLEEYVVAKLQGDSIEHCSGRYKGVEDMTEMKKSQAKDKLKQAGLEYELFNSDNPAPSKELEKTIESHDPGPNSVAKRGDTVKLYIYDSYVPPEIKVPDVIGKPKKKAKIIIMDAGLDVEFIAGIPALSVQQEKTIESQYPRPGRELKQGETVELTFYGKYNPYISVPNVIGKTKRRAKEIIMDARLDIKFIVGTPSSSEQQEKTIESQYPEPGKELKQGETVELTFYGKYNPYISVPDVIGKTKRRAKEIIMDAGLDIKFIVGTPASSEQQEKTIESQYPRPGRELKQGETVQLTFYGKYKPRVVQTTDDGRGGDTIKKRGPDLSGRWQTKRGFQVIDIRQEGNYYNCYLVKVSPRWIPFGYRVGELVHKFKYRKNRWEPSTFFFDGEVKNRHKDGTSTWTKIIYTYIVSEKRLFYTVKVSDRNYYRMSQGDGKKTDGGSTGNGKDSEFDPGSSSYIGPSTNTFGQD